MRRWLLAGLIGSICASQALACEGVFLRDSQNYDNRSPDGHLETIEGVVPKGTRDDIIGYAIVDDELRRLCGMAPVADPKMPLSIFDASNAADAGTPPQLSQGYGDAYVEGYAKLWQLK